MNTKILSYMDVWERHLYAVLIQPIWFNIQINQIIKLKSKDMYTWFIHVYIHIHIYECISIVYKN